MTALGATTSPAGLVPGDPEEVAWLAREYGRYAGGACDAVRALRRIDTGAWVGPAGDAFRTAIGEVPEKLERGQAAFARASSVLSDYARGLRDAQSDAAQAIRRHADGDAATARWRDQPERERTADDPGEPDRLAAERILANARERVAAAAVRAAAALDDARHGAPHEPGLLSKAVHAVGSFVAGAGEATWGLAELGFTLSPTYALIDPAGFVDNAENLAKGVVHGVRHPKEVGKAMLDWDTWAHDPARALGHLVPDLLLAVATAGAGEAGVAAGRALQGAEATEALATRGVAATAQAAGLSEEEAALLETRFADPTEEVLGAQGERPYKGVDPWRGGIVKPGDTMGVGWPGEGRFAATSDAVEQVGTDARAYNEGLQIGSQKSRVDGVARYRTHLHTYEVKKPFPVAESVAQANPRFGAGGLSQYFLPDDIERLVEEGFLESVSMTPVTDIDAVIGPRGTSVLTRVPAARGTLAGGATLAASGLTRAGGCG